MLMARLNVHNISAARGRPSAVASSHLPLMFVRGPNVDKASAARETSLVRTLMVAISSSQLSLMRVATPDVHTTSAARGQGFAKVPSDVERPNVDKSVAAR